jgi:hypothetical protein
VTGLTTTQKRNEYQVRLRIGKNKLGRMINEVVGTFPLLALPVSHIVNELGESKMQSLGNNFKDVMDNQPGC